MENQIREILDNLVLDYNCYAEKAAIAEADGDEFTRSRNVAKKVAIRSHIDSLNAVLGKPYTNSIASQGGNHYMIYITTPKTAYRMTQL